MESKEIKRDIKDSERERARRPICLNSEREGEKEREKRPMLE